MDIPNPYTLERKDAITYSWYTGKEGKAAGGEVTYGVQRE